MRPLAAGDRTAADAVEEFPTDSRPGDYLLYFDGHSVADIEAKRLEVGPQNVVEQAKRYARILADSPFHFGVYRLLCVYTVNGALISPATSATLSRRRGRSLASTRQMPRATTSGWRARSSTIWAGSLPNAWW